MTDSLLRGNDAKAGSHHLLNMLTAYSEITYTLLHYVSENGAQVGKDLSIRRELWAKEHVNGIIARVNSINC